MILSTVIFVTIAFIATILIVANISLSNSIERSKKMDTENASRLTASLNDSFDSATRLLSLAQQSFAEFDFHDGMAHESVGNILTTLLELNPDAHSAWFVAEPGIHHEDRHCITEYLWRDGSIMINNTTMIAEYLKTPETALWYYMPLTTGKAHLGTLRQYDYGDGPVYNATISVPIVDHGKIIGVCGIDIIYSDILDMPSFREEQNRSVMLISQHMTILHAEDRELVGRNLFEFSYEDIEAMHTAMDRREAYAKEIVEPLTQKKSFLYLQPISFTIDPEQAPLYLYISTPLNELYADAYEIVAVLVAVSLLCMLCILLIILFNIRRIIQPIRALTGQAQQITEGDFGLEVFGSPDDDPDDKNEVAVLRRAFIKVLHALQENLRTVENRVQERTQELTTLNNYINILLESTSNVSILLDRDLNLVYCSKNYLAMQNIDDFSKIKGKSAEPRLEDYPDADYVERIRNRMNRILSGEEYLVEDDAVTWPDGTSRLYRIIYNKVKDEDNNFNGLIIVMLDLTDVRLEEAQRRQDDLIRSTKIPCMIWNDDGEPLAINEEFTRFFDLPADMSSDDTNTVFSIISPEIQPNGQKSETLRLDLLESAIKKGFAQASVQLRKADGTPVYILVNLTRISWLSDYRLVVYCFDRTDLVLREAEAREAEESVKVMLDSNPMICFLRDKNGDIIDCNQEALNIFGVAEKTEMCKNISRYFPEFQPDGSNSVEKSKKMIKTLFEEGSVESFEWMFTTAAGEPLPVETTFVRINWKDSCRFLSYSRDLRKEKANEQKVLESLERERALMIQKEAAQAANETKSQFIAHMSHEIRTPMNAVLGMAELLLQENLNDRQFGYAKDIKTSSDALLEIINDILDLSKIQAGKLSLIPVHYDFGKMLDNICSIARFLIEYKDITFELETEGEIPVYLLGDDIRLRQVLLNLLGNAVKFTEAGQIRMTILVTAAGIRFTVSDTGIGIKAENISKLFDAFEQFDAQKNRYKCGTGLGLSITKALVELMNGQISVESVYGQGTSFHVDIPVVLGDEALVRHPEGNDVVISAPDARILVVDDNTVNLNVAGGLLRLCQITAETATSGRQAIELIKQNRYDIVFMDHMMPEMDGLETTRIIREQGVDIPVIALTASAVSGTKELMLAAGMDDYLSKPIIFSQLKNTLIKWLPADKQLRSSPAGDETGNDGNNDFPEFWERIGQIEGLSLSEGLDMVEGQRDVYIKMLRLMIKEIEKCERNLKEFLDVGDMRNFCIEVHGIKNSLTSIGATKLGNSAYELETASNLSDGEFCSMHLPALLEGLGNLRLQLREIFSDISCGDDIVEIPPELPPILECLTDAFREMDIVAIDEGVERLNELSLAGALGGEIEQLSDAVIMMDFDYAIEVIQRLTRHR